MHMCGVFAGTIEWMVSKPATRPRCRAYVAEVLEAFCSVCRYAALLGSDDRACDTR